ncbi:hypothetical protein L7F22_006144 [Adiantum nelumboides]|nr:hypothetical protein [Adiantum nelumboides]
MAQTARLASRLQRELKMLLSDPPPGVSAWPCDGHNLTHLSAQIHGPEGTVYANGVFKLDIQVPERYPFEPPNIKFNTPVYHPNIDNGGRICLDLLNLPPKGAWRPSLNLSILLASIGLLLADPNPDDGLMGDITAEYKHDRLSFDAKARNWTELYASQDQVHPETKPSHSPANAEPSQGIATARLHGQEQSHTSGSFEERMNLNCTTSAQSLRPSLSVSKRLTLARGVGCFQETNAASSQNKTLLAHSVSSEVETNGHTKVAVQSLRELAMKEKQFNSSIGSETSTYAIVKKLKPPVHLNEQSRDPLRGNFFEEMAVNNDLDATFLQSQSKEMPSEAVGKDSQYDGGCVQSFSTCADAFDAQKGSDKVVPTSGLKCNDMAIEGTHKQPPVDVHSLKELETQKSESKLKRKLAAHIEEKASNLARGDIVDEITANSTCMFSDSALSKRPSKLGECCQSDGICVSSVPQYVKAFDAQEGNDKSTPTSRINSKDYLGTGKENQIPKRCFAAQAKDGNLKHLAGEEKLSAEGGPMEVSSNLNSSPCLNVVHDHGVMDRNNLCLPPRTKSLKLIRAKPDSGSFHETKGQRNIWAEKQQTTVADEKRNIHTVGRVNAPIIVVSDSESDSERSNECSTLFLTQRDLNDKRKAKFKLR